MGRRGRPPRDKERETREAQRIVLSWLDEARRIDWDAVDLDDLMGRTTSVVRRPQPGGFREP